MNAESTVEQRLTALEKAVADLQKRMAQGRVPENWLEHVTGAVTDDEAFRKILEYGREFRYADRPSDAPDEQP